MSDITPLILELLPSKAQSDPEIVDTAKAIAELWTLAPRIARRIEKSFINLVITKYGEGDRPDSSELPELIEDEVYLTEIWQNINGRKASWYQLMIWIGNEWILYSDPRVKPAFNQVVHKWVRIADIQDWTSTLTHDSQP